MRELSEVEKKILKKILLDGITLEKLIGTICKDTIIKVNKEKKSVDLIREKLSDYGKSDISNEFKDLWIDRLLFISTLIHLLSYLEENGYILSHLISNVNDNEYYIGNSKLIQDFKEQSISIVTYDFDDEFIINHIIKYVYRVIQPTESLKLYVKNGFKTIDQIRFEKNYKITMRAVSISLFIGIASLCISIISILISGSITNDQFKELSNKSTKIDSGQTKELSNKLDSIYIQLKSIDSSINHISTKAQKANK